MKKTIITLLALAGVAAAVDNAPIEYDAYILQLNNTGTKITSLTSTRGQIWFNEDAATLSSWMIEFSLDKLNGGNDVLFATNFGTAGQGNERYGLSVYSWFDQSGVTIGKDSNHFTGAANLTFPSNPQLPVTLRLAYDAVGDKAYLYCVETDAITSVATTVDYTLNGSTIGGGSDVSGLGSFWTDGGKDNFTIYTVTDMSALAGNADSFAEYVKTKTVPAVPEPTTATLSLLALAGLAARRRRK